jgi:hypothetical protein
LGLFGEESFSPFEKSADLRERERERESERESEKEIEERSRRRATTPLRSCQETVENFSLKRDEVLGKQTSLTVLIIVQLFMHYF